MILDRKNNAKRNIVQGIINKLVTLFMPFLVSSVLNRTLGAEYLGINGLFGSILHVLSLAELGFGDAIVYSMYKPIAQNDTETICALLNMYKKVYRLIGIIIFGVGIFLTPLLPYLINGSYPKEVNIYIIYIMYLIRTVLSYWLYAYKTSILNAFQRMDVISGISTITSALTSILQLILLLNCKNFYFFLTISIACIILNNLLVSWNVDRLYPEYVCKGKVSTEMLSDIKRKVGGLLVGKICGTTRNTFDNIYMSMFFGLTVAAMYSNYFNIMSTINGFISIIVSSVLAGVGNSIELESVNKNYFDMQKMDYIYMLLSGWCAVCLLCLYQPFMKLWMGEQLLFPIGMVFLFTLYFYIRKMGDIRCLYSDAAGLFWENRHRYFADIIANIVLNYLFVVKWGTYGIVSATILTLFLFGFLSSASVLFKHYFKQGMREYLAGHLKYFCVTATIAAITYWICSFIHISDLVDILIRGIICCTLSPLLYFLFYFRSKQFRSSMVWLKNVFIGDELQKYIE